MTTNGVRSFASPGTVSIEDMGIWRRHLFNGRETAPMPSGISRRDVLYASAGSVSIGVAGCLGNESRGSRATRTAVATVSDTEAKQRALEAEKWYIFDRLQKASCVTSGAASGTTVDSKPVVSERTADVVEVQVTQGYHFSTTDGLEADGATTARYVVSGNSTRRIQGDPIDPC